MIITCPWCGNRDAGEFTYQGDGNRSRPSLAGTSIDEYNAYVYDRENPAGQHRELWQHTGGCRSHVLVTRDTTNHKIISCKATGGFALTKKRRKK